MFWVVAIVPPSARRLAPNLRHGRGVKIDQRRDFATASTLFPRDTMPGKVGRQQQSWARFDDGWRTVAAHVSVLETPP